KASVAKALLTLTSRHEHSAHVKVRCARFPAQIGAPGTGTSMGGPPFWQVAGGGMTTAGTQPPPAQPSPAPQLWPHVPRLWLSVALWTQWLLQGEGPGRRVALHRPPEHARLPVHVVPQPPQFDGSVTVSMQWPPQNDW